MKFVVMVPVGVGRNESYANLCKSINERKGDHDVTVIEKFDFKGEGAGPTRRALLAQARKLKPDAVISLDDDMEITEGFFDTVSTGIDTVSTGIYSLTMKTGEITTYGSKVDDTDGVLQRSERLDKLTHTDWAPAGAMVITGDALANKDFTYPNLPLGEDISLYYLAKRFGYTPVKVLDAVVIHKPGGAELAPGISGFRSEENYEKLKVHLWHDEGVYYDLPLLRSHLTTEITDINGKHYHPIFDSRDSFQSYLDGLPIQPVVAGERATNDRWKLMNEFLKNYTVNTYLDLGCNVGFFCHAMSTKNVRSFGVDSDYHIEKVKLTDESPIARAKYLTWFYKLPAVFVRDDALHFLQVAKEKNYRFDIISAFSILHHMPDWREAVTMIADRCKIGAFIEIPLLKDYNASGAEVINHLHDTFSKVEMIGDSKDGWEGERPLFFCSK